MIEGKWRTSGFYIKGWMVLAFLWGILFLYCHIFSFRTEPIVKEVALLSGMGLVLTAGAIIVFLVRSLQRIKQPLPPPEERAGSMEIPDGDKEFVARLQKVLLANLSDSSLNSEFLADKLCMSKSQLNRKVKKLTATDTATYIRQTRMSFAKKLLSAGDISIGDIVERCGFDSPSYFAKIFKQYHGMTPSQYRKHTGK